MPSWLCSLNRDFNLDAILVGSGRRRTKTGREEEGSEDEEEHEGKETHEGEEGSPHMTVIFTQQLYQTEGSRSVCCGCNKLTALCGTRVRMEREFQII